MFEDLTVLLKPQYHTLWTNYCRYLDMGWKRFCKEEYSPQTKREQLHLLEAAIRRDFPLSGNLLSRLQHAFVAENLSLYLLLDPLSAWRCMASENMPDSEMILTEIVQRAVSPAARLLMVLNDENPSTYLPMTSFLATRFLMQLQAQKSPLLHNIKLSKKQWIRKYNGLLKNAFILLQIVDSKRLKFRLAIHLNTMQNEITKLKNNNKQLPADLLDRIKIIVYSIYQFIAVRKRTTTNKGL